MINNEPEYLSAKQLESNNDWLGALEIYILLSNTRPDDVALLERVGWCQSRAGLYDKAIETYNKIVGLTPGKAKAKYLYNIGYQFYMQKEWDGAIESFNKALELYPGYFIVKYRLAYALSQKAGVLYKLKSKEYLEAYKQLEDCLSLWDKMNDEQKTKNKKAYSDICFQKGKIHLERDENDKAVNCFKISCDIAPMDIDFRYNLAKSLFYAGKYDDALTEINKIRGKYYINKLKADILFNMCRYREALEILEKETQTRKRDYLFREIADIYIELNEMQIGLAPVKLDLTKG